MKDKRAKDLEHRPLWFLHNPMVFESGAGSLVSTVDDFLTFARMPMNGGEYHRIRLVSARSVEEMTTDHLTREQKDCSPQPHQRHRGELQLEWRLGGSRGETTRSEA